MPPALGDKLFLGRLKCLQQLHMPMDYFSNFFNNTEMEYRESPKKKKKEKRVKKIPSLVGAGAGAAPDWA